MTCSMKFDDHSADMGAAAVEASDFVSPTALNDVERRRAVHETSFGRDRRLFLLIAQTIDCDAKNLFFYLSDIGWIYAQGVSQLDHRQGRLFFYAFSHKLAK